MYGGIEDVTDNTKGLALSLNASQLVYDGGVNSEKLFYNMILQLLKWIYEQGGSACSSLDPFKRFGKIQVSREANK